MNREGKKDKDNNALFPPHQAMTQPFYFMPHLYYGGYDHLNQLNSYMTNQAYGNMQQNRYIRLPPPYHPSQRRQYSVTKDSRSFNENVSSESINSMVDKKFAQFKDQRDLRKLNEDEVKDKILEDKGETNLSEINGKMDGSTNQDEKIPVKNGLTFDQTSEKEETLKKFKTKDELVEWVLKEKKFFEGKSIDELSGYINNKEQGDSDLQTSENSRMEENERIKKEYEDFFGGDSEDDLITDLDLLDNLQKNSYEDEEMLNGKNEEKNINRKKLIECNYHSVVNKIQNFFLTMDHLGCSVDAFVMYKNEGNRIFDEDGNVVTESEKIFDVQSKLDNFNSSDKNEVVEIIVDDVEENELNEEENKPKRIKYTSEEFYRILIDFTERDSSCNPFKIPVVEDFNPDSNVYRTSSSKERKVVEKVKFTNLETSNDAFGISENNPLKDVIHYLNILTPSNFGECVADCDSIISKLEIKAGIISESLLNSIVFSTLSVVPFAYFVKDLTKSHRSVCDGISSGCRRLLEARYEKNDKLVELKAQLASLLEKDNKDKESSSKIKADSLNVDILDIEEKQRSRIIRSASLYAWFYNLDLISNEAFYSFVGQLIGSGVDYDVIYLCRMLTISGMKMMSCDSKRLAEIVEKLKEYTINSDMTVVFTVIDLIDDYNSEFTLAESHEIDKACISELKRSAKEHFCKVRYKDSRATVATSKTSEDGFIVAGKFNGNLEGKGKQFGVTRSIKKPTEVPISVTSRFDLFSHNASADDPLVDCMSRLGSHVKSKNSLKELSEEEIEHKADTILQYCTINDIESAIAVFKEVLNTKSVGKFLASLYLLYCDQISHERACLIKFYEKLCKQCLIGKDLISEMVGKTFGIYEEDDLISCDFPRFIPDFAHVVLIFCGFRPDIRALFEAVKLCQNKHNFINSILIDLKTETSSEVAKECWLSSKLELSDFDSQDVEELSSFIDELIF